MMTKVRDEFGAILRKLRLERKWTLKKVSQITDIDLSNLSMIERQSRDCRLGTLVRLADCFGLTLDELVGRKPPKREASHEKRAH